MNYCKPCGPDVGRRKFFPFTTSPFYCPPFTRLYLYSFKIPLRLKSKLLCRLL